VAGEASKCSQRYVQGWALYSGPMNCRWRTTPMGWTHPHPKLWVKCRHSTAEPNRGEERRGMARLGQSLLIYSRVFCWTDSRLAALGLQSQLKRLRHDDSLPSRVISRGRRNSCPVRVSGTPLNPLANPPLDPDGPLTSTATPTSTLVGTTLFAFGTLAQCTRDVRPDTVVCSILYHRKRQV
jgi:hypothetical protein